MRQALRDAQNGDTITFDPTVFPPTAPTTIQLGEGGFSWLDDNPIALPIVTQGNLTIDASNAGVILDGSAIEAGWVNGLAINSSGNVVQGLQLVNFTGNGILIFEGSGNVIGGDRSIGAGPLGQGNLSSSNMVGIGLWGSGSSNAIVGNVVGQDPSTSLDWGNQLAGVIVSSETTNNTLGPDNVIAHNLGEGILIFGDSVYGNVVTENSIHDNALGIRLWAGANNLVEPPLISSFDLGFGAVSGRTCADCIVEFFSATGVEGDLYEGTTMADGVGVFAFDRGQAFAGPYVVATATDRAGNTSEFSRVVAGYELFQEGNTQPIVELRTRPSNELEDNRIGIHFVTLWDLAPEVFPDGELNVDHILSQGVTRARFAINSFDFDIASTDVEAVYWDVPEIPIDPRHDDFITDLSDNGIAITYVLAFWDKEYVAQGGEIPSPRFKTEEEVLRYLDFVRHMVRQLKDRVEYFEIWNEPGVSNSIGSIDLEDYIRLVARTVPVIRQEYPEAKIVVGGEGDMRDQDHFDYLMGVIGSDEIMPIVDAVSWHGMYGASPEGEGNRVYYYNYPSMVARIKETARSHGFRGEFVSDEMNWATRASPNFWRSDWFETQYSETTAAKYFVRGILMNLGLDLSVSHFYVVPAAHPQRILGAIRNVSTIMAGAEPIDLAVSIESEATDIVAYSFTAPNGDLLVALWTDGVARDVDLGIATTVTLSGLSARTTTAIDAVYGYESELMTDLVDGNLVIRDLLVRDSPLVLRLSGVVPSLSLG